MGELMKDEGSIVANDIHSHKGKLIADQAARLGLDCIRTVTGDALELPARFEPASFDRILLDAPCSGLGVIRRKPDLKWGKTEEDIREIAALQSRLLDSVSALLRPGGVLVYSTCTIEPQENEGVVTSFVNRHPEFELDETGSLSRLKDNALVRGGGIQILPQHYHSDGFYIARLRRR